VFEPSLALSIRNRASIKKTKPDQKNRVLSFSVPQGAMYDEKNGGGVKKTNP